MTLAKYKDLNQEKLTFMDYQATAQLQHLASNSMDLAQSGQLTSDRLAKYCGRACGYTLLYGTERVTDEVLKALEHLAKESQALDKMKRMQEGETVNFIQSYPSENRSVLHTATRDFFDQPQTTLKAQRAAQLAYQEIEKLKIFIGKLEQENAFDDMIVIGIGGSDQGPRANYTALEHLLKTGKQVHFIANVDPDDAIAVTRKVNLKRSLVVAISKSGTTLETETNEALVKEQFKKIGLNPRNHFISVSMPGTPMDNTQDYMETFYLWDWVGGRYSTTSMVGGIVLAFAFGFEVFWEFLRGAHAMDRAALQKEIHANIPLLAALLGIWNRNFLHYPTVAVIPYSQALCDYPDHLQQVDMESNGKSITQQGQFVNFETGPILWGSLGTNAQHSYFQLLHQGSTTVPLFMIGFKKSRYGEDLEVRGTTSQEKLLANLFAQSLALALGNRPENPNKFFPGNRPTTILLGEQVTPYSIGALLAFYEHKVAFQGFIWGINSFDQEGVQLGKMIANRFIDRFASLRQNAEKTQSKFIRRCLFTTFRSSYALKIHPIDWLSNTMNSLLKIEIPRRSSHCACQGERLVAGMEIYSLLIEDDNVQRMIRKDFCLACWTQVRASQSEQPLARGYWKSKIDKQKEAPISSRIERSFALLRRLQNEIELQEAEIFVLCLFLSHARQMALRQEFQKDGMVYHLYEILHREEFLTVKVIPLSQFQIEALQKSLVDQLQRYEM